MLFKVHDQDELAQVSADVQTMRMICTDSLRRIQRCRESVLETCENRAFLSDARQENRLRFAAAMMQTAMRTAHNGIFPSPSADAFLRSLREDEGKHGVAARLASKILGTAKNDPLREIKREIEGYLSLYPEFDVLAYRHGQPQSAEFIAEFEIDLPMFREAVLESRKPFVFLRESENDFHDLVKIHDEFSHELRGRLSKAEIDDFISNGVKCDAPYVHINDDPEP